MKTFIGKDMPESMFPPPRPQPTPICFRARGTHAKPEPDAINFLSILAKHFNTEFAMDIMEFHRLIFFGRPLTREGLIDCLRMKFGRTWLDQLQQKMLLTTDSHG